jgi:hypothetical protein
MIAGTYVRSIVYEDGTRACLVMLVTGWRVLKEPSTYISKAAPSLICFGVRNRSKPGQLHLQFVRSRSEATTGSHLLGIR